MDKIKQYVELSTECMICLKIAKKANMCPNCSKIACEKCFKVSIFL